MSYTSFPISQDATDFFTEAGIIGGSTNMLPLINGAGSEFPPFDGNYGAAATIKESVCEVTWPGASYVGFNLGAAYERVLGVAFVQQGSSKVGFQESTINAAAEMSAGYLAGMNNSACTILERTAAPSWAVLASASIGLSDVPSSAAAGVAVYIDGGTNTIDLYFKYGSSSQWMKVLTGSDATVTSFQSCLIRTSSSPTGGVRWINPMMIWGAV